MVTGAMAVNWRDLPDQRRGHVRFVVHGFNVDRKRGWRSGGALAQELHGPPDLSPQINLSQPDMIIPILWPGDGFILWSYFTAFGQSNDTATKFATFLLDPDFDAQEVSFLSHSLGARVVLKTIDRTLEQAKAPLKFRFRQALLTAAAVDDTALDAREFKHVSSPEGPDDIVVLSSLKDDVLAKAFTLGDLVEGALWDNYQGSGRALGRFGPAFTAQSAAKSKTRWYAYSSRAGQGHDGYMPQPWEPPATPAALPGWTNNVVKTTTAYRDLMSGVPVSVDPEWLTKM